MNTKPVRLTKFQRSELFYLLNDVMSEGFDEAGNTLEGFMAHSYGWVNVAEFDAFVEKLGEKRTAPSLVIDMTEREARCAWGEYENRYDIDINNVDEPGDEYDRAATKMKDAMTRIESAFSELEFRA